MQEKVIEIDLSEQLFAAIVSDHAQGTDAGRATGSEEGIQWCGKRAYVESAGALDVTDDINPDTTQTRYSHGDLHIAILLF